MNFNKKIKQIAELGSLLNAQKENNDIVVLCHGVFDLLHIGHIKYFQEAKSMGDILVVTLTPDRFVNKGPGRPAFNEKHRSEAIAALDVVDYVAINKWPTGMETIKALNPDLYVKGPDYKNLSGDITGNIKLEKEAIESVGGKIAFTSTEVFSSSNLINNYILENDNKKSFISKLKNEYSYRDIYEYIENLTDLNVLLIGEVIIDEYVFCNSVGKAGKEPVMVSQKIRSEKYAGGVVSVANHISEFCKNIKVLSYLGDKNQERDFIINNLNENVEFEYIEKNDSPTILKTRYIDEYSKTKTQGIYDINDQIISENEEGKFLGLLDENISNYDLVIVVDYGHGLITPKVVEILEKESKFLSVNTQLNSFNSSFHSISKYQTADYVCVHSGELRHDYRNRYDSEESLMKDLFKKMNLKSLSITLGKNGSILLHNDTFTKCPAFADKIVDRVGAGDTFLSITSLCVAKKTPERITLFLGSILAANSIASVGTGNISKKINLLKSVKALMV
jgi:rfaE bifunctional protein kinase chain/domain/rfaE bifunctional protein nucleotidyltransferase chain/domain